MKLLEIYHTSKDVFTLQQFRALRQHFIPSGPHSGRHASGIQQTKGVRAVVTATGALR